MCDRIADLTDEEFVQAVYHSGYYKNIVNNEKLKRAEKRFREYSLSSKSVLPLKKGRPSRSDSLSSDDYVTVKRSRRSTSTPGQTKTCVFQCSHPTTGELDRVKTDIMGSRFISIKAKTQHENVRVALAHVNEPSDCAALDLVYHRNCLREQEPKIEESIANMDTQSQSNIV